MQLNSPFIITSRLMAGVKVGNATISIEFSSLPAGGRQRYRYYIDAPEFEHSADDLKSGMGGGSLQEGMASLLSFLSACAESVAYGRRTGRPGENTDLFPPHVAAWAEANSDELSMLAIELEETPDLITD